MDLLQLYTMMFRSRIFEMAVTELWDDGLISGEMHLGTGEEAATAGILTHLEDEDALALDHRGTPALLMAGVPAVDLLREMLGEPDGLCGGRGGHMHFFSREHRIASSGIVGAAGPLGAGFALSARTLRPGSVAVSFFGEGAVNQGMLLEALNLAKAWNLPQIFVCKDNGWAITTQSKNMTGGDLVSRARGFGLSAEDAHGSDVEQVASVAADAVRQARRGRGPTFLRIRTPRLDGHFLGDPLVAAARKPITDGSKTFSKVISGIRRLNGSSLVSRMRSVTRMIDALWKVRSHGTDPDDDPIHRARKRLIDRGRDVDALEADIVDSVALDVQQALSNRQVSDAPRVDLRRSH